MGDFFRAVEPHRAIFREFFRAVESNRAFCRATVRFFERFRVTERGNHRKLSEIIARLGSRHSKVLSKVSSKGLVLLYTYTYIWGLAICLWLLFDQQNDVGKHQTDERISKLEMSKGICKVYIGFIQGIHRVYKGFIQSIYRVYRGFI